MKKVLRFWNSRRSAAIALSYISFVVTFCTWVCFILILPDPMAFVNFLYVVFRPPQLIIYVILVLGNDYVSGHGYNYPAQKKESLKKRNQKLHTKNKELSLRLRIADSRISRQLTDVSFLKAVLDKILDESCPVCLSKVEEYLEVENNQGVW